MRGWWRRGCAWPSASRWSSKTSQEVEGQLARRIARAAPDGNTIVYGAIVTPAHRRGAQPHYDVVADFEPIALIGDTPWLFVGRTICR